MVMSATNEAAVQRQGPATAKSLAKSHQKKPPRKKAQPLSAYNLFFRYERARLIFLAQSGQSIHIPPTCITKAQLRDFLEENPNPTPGEKRKRLHRKTHGAVSFTDLSKIVGNNWKALDAKSKKTFQDVSHEIKVELYREQDEERRKARQHHLPCSMRGSLDAELYPKMDKDGRRMTQAQLTRSMPPTFQVPAGNNGRVESRPVPPAPRSSVEKEVASLLVDFSQGAPTSARQHNRGEGIVPDFKTTAVGGRVETFPEASSSPMDQFTATRVLLESSMPDRFGG